MQKNIPVIRSTMPTFEEYVEEIRPLWESRWLTNMGAKHNELEEQLKALFGTRNVSLFVNGHQALELGLQALQLQGEVITTTFTFASTTHAIVRSGLKPVFCDIKEDDYTIDADKIEALITEKTCAIVPVHVYGNVCDVEKIEAIAKKHNLKVIYDAAHAFGESYKGKNVMAYGDLSMCSFHATKVFHTIEGGCLSYNDDRLANSLFELRDFGIKDAETVEIVGSNAKLNEFCAAMGLCNLRHFNKTLAKRKRLVELYRQLLAKVPGIKLNYRNPDTEENYSYFPIVVNEEEYGCSRDELVEYLKGYGVFTRKYFYPLINEFACYRTEYSAKDTPIALAISKRVMTLPLYEDLSEEEVRYIAELIINKKI